MTRLLRVLPALLMGGLLLQACAGTTPTSTDAPKAAGAGAAKRANGKDAKSGYGTMAPIANPPQEPHPAPRPMHETAEPERSPQPRPEPPRPEAPPPNTEAPKPPPPSKTTAADHQRAAKLRTQGLTRLNSGAVDRAVTLLQQAAELDPENALIKRDLERALRISRLVHQPK